MTGRDQYCEACRVFQNQTAKSYDCAQCDQRQPVLWPENREAWVIWTLVNTQWRVSALSLVGLDYPAVFQIAAVYGIGINPALFQKLRALELLELSRNRKEEDDGRDC